MTACDPCLRRAWLLGELSAHHERTGGGRGRTRLRDVLALDDDELIEAVGGQAAGGVRARHAAFDARAARSAAANAGLTTLCRHDEAYPAGLRTGAGAPAALYVAGRLDLFDEGPAVAIVGSRRASPDGLEVARMLGRGLAAAGVTVVSGMAMGIDAAAHTGALEGGGRTIAVLATGADVAYPTVKRGLHRRLCAEQCVVSEMPPGARPFRWAFPARNRIIAGLTGLTVVVEAAERSGSLITSDFATDLGREVAAVPGSVLNPRARGTNALLRDGAIVVRDAQDVLDALFDAGCEAPTAPVGSSRGCASCSMRSRPATTPSPRSRAGRSRRPRC